MANEEFSCQQFRDANSGGTYFVSIRHAAVKGEEGAADLTLTDGARAWTAQGVTSDTIQGDLRHLLAALSELQQPELQYSTEVKLQADGAAVLRVLWKQAGTGVGQFVRAVLSEALPAGPVVAGMLQLLLGNLTALKDTCAGLLEQSRGFERQASRSQEVIDKYVKNKEEHDREMYVKVAALLNSKKQKLRDLKAQLENAREEIQRLQLGGGGPMDEDAAAEAGTSRQHGAQRHGKAVRVVDSDDEGEVRQRFTDEYDSEGRVLTD